MTRFKFQSIFLMLAITVSSYVLCMERDENIKGDLRKYDIYEHPLSGPIAMGLDFETALATALSFENDSVDTQHSIPKKYPPLKILDLSDTNLTHLNDLAYLPTLTNLNFSRNKIEKINNYTFMQCSNLKFLSLSNLQLKKIEPHAFYGLTNLESLNLNNNQLEECDPEVFSMLIKLRNLYLSNNKFLKLTAATFNKLYNLEWLHLECNPLSKENIEILKNEMPKVRILNDYESNIK